MSKQGYFVRHKVTGFETYIPAEHWDESYKEEFHIRDPEAELKKALADMKEASDRHDKELVRRAEEAKKKPTFLAPPKE